MMIYVQLHRGNDPSIGPSLRLDNNLYAWLRFILPSFISRPQQRQQPQIGPIWLLLTEGIYKHQLFRQNLKLMKSIGCRLFMAILTPKEVDRTTTSVIFFFLSSFCTKEILYIDLNIYHPWSRIKNYNPLKRFKGTVLLLGAVIA